MKLWLTRCNGGRYILTAMKPLILPIRGYRSEDGNLVYDAYERAGEPIAVRYLCADGIRALFKKDFPYLVPTKVEIIATEFSKVRGKEIIEKDVDIPKD